VITEVQEISSILKAKSFNTEPAYRSLPRGQTGLPTERR